MSNKSFCIQLVDILRIFKKFVHQICDLWYLVANATFAGALGVFSKRHIVWLTFLDPILVS